MGYGLENSKKHVYDFPLWQCNQLSGILVELLLDE